MPQGNNQTIVEKIKRVTEKGIQSRLETGSTVKFRTLISQELKADYTSLCDLFLLQQGISLDNFIISRILEKVKELLVYTEKTFKEVARALGYQSTTYLAAQLKKHTGFTSSHFKQIRRDKLTIIENYQNSKQ